MSDEEAKPKRRRRRRRKRSGPAGDRPSPPDQRSAALPQARRAPQPPDWEWRTFPVFFAFAAGALTAIVLLFLLTPPILVLAAALFGVAFGIAHIVSRNYVARRRR